MLLPWSKSDFPCLSAVMAVINAPAVHFKQDLQEKHRVEKRERKGRIYVPVKFPFYIFSVLCKRTAGFQWKMINSKMQNHVQSVTLVKHPVPY